MIGYGKDESMRRYEIIHGSVWRRVGVLVLAGALGFSAPLAEVAGIWSGGQTAVTVYAAEDMLGYENPERIVIAMQTVKSILPQHLKSVFWEPATTDIH